MSVDDGLIHPLRLAPAELLLETFLRAGVLGKDDDA
jgi:hypothetical protein